MPLPPNGILSLQGPVGPGGADTLKPKQAMIVRMSQETFEALEAQPNPPKVEVEFGANSVCCVDFELCVTVLIPVRGYTLATTFFLCGHSKRACPTSSTCGLCHLTRLLLHSDSTRMSSENSWLNASWDRRCRTT